MVNCTMLPTEVPIVSVARCFVSLLVSFTYPLQCNPARRCVMTLLASIFKDEEKDPASLENVIFMRYIIVTVSVILFFFFFFFFLSPPHNLKSSPFSWFPLYHRFICDRLRRDAIIGWCNWFDFGVVHSSWFLLFLFVQE